MQQNIFSKKTQKNLNINYLWKILFEQCSLQSHFNPKSQTHTRSSFSTLHPNPRTFNIESPRCTVQREPCPCIRGKWKVFGHCAQNVKGPSAVSDSLFYPETIPQKKSIGTPNYQRLIKFSALAQQFFFFVIKRSQPRYNATVEESGPGTKNCAWRKMHLASRRRNSEKSRH